MLEKKSKRKQLNEKQVAKIIKEWNKKSIEEFASEFEVAPNTVRSMVYEIRKMDPNLCPKKPKRKREDIVKAALKMISAVDELTDK
jgi:hypothetical protein